VVNDAAGDVAYITVGRWVQEDESFFVDGLEYYVSKLGLVDDRWDDWTGREDLKYITLRNPLCKDDPLVTGDETVELEDLSVIKTCIPPMENLPFLPPFNMDHDIIDDVDIPELADLDFEDYEDPKDYDPDLDKAPDEQDLDETDISARVLPEVPVVEYYIDETKEPRFDTNLLEEKFTEPFEEWRWINIETMPWDYTEFVLPEIPDIAEAVGFIGDYILVSSWLTEDSTDIWGVPGGWKNPDPEGEAIRMKFTYDATDGTGIYVNRIGMDCLGDFNGDGVVDLADIVMMLPAWNTTVGDALYDPLYDLDADGDIDLADIMTVVSNWGPCS
jgi:hypothetical protein